RYRATESRGRTPRRYIKASWTARLRVCEVLGEVERVDVRLPDSPDALTGVAMFAALDPEVRQRVIAAAVPRTYRKGQLLFVENDPGDSLIVLKRGAIAVFRTSPTGERAVLTVIRPPDTFGEV